MTKQKDSVEKAIRDIRRAARRQYWAKEEIGVLLYGLRGEDRISELCCKEGIKWNRLPEKGRKSTLVLALERPKLSAHGLEQAAVKHRPRLLPDNGSSCLSVELKNGLDDHGIGHPHGRPYHPMAQGMVERRHGSMKTRCCWNMTICPAT